MQYQSYLKGFYFHSKGNYSQVNYQRSNISEAIRWYTKSLYEASDKSVNFWRLQALENIESILQEDSL